jgi:hypothetical protein
VKEDDAKQVDSKKKKKEGAKEAASVFPLLLAD